MKALSPETRLLLETESLSNLSAYVDMTEKVRGSIRMLENAAKYLEENGKSLPEEYPHLKRLSECSLLVGLIWLDITMAFRIYLNARENYEIVYAVKQLTVTINEGFKKVYNYNSLKDGKLITRNREQSFWVKDIGTIVKNDLQGLLPSYNQITAALNTYDDQELQAMQGPRQLFVHYDHNPSLVYDELQKQDIEKITIKVLPFMNILRSMLDFLKVLLEDYNKLITTRKNDMLNDYHQKFGALKTAFSSNPEVLKMLSDVQDFLKDHQAK